ncbi:MAG: JAB domain-containing protein [Gammaproteobacteria bacterium]|nr:JAB domain-containing protein [Gammaproteobacteria bacterium]
MAYIKELKVTFERKRVDDDLLKAPVESSTRVYELFGHLQDETKEKVVVLHLNPQLEILSYEVSAIGTAHRALIDAVEIYRNAMLARASVLIVVHNHPSGDPSPSEADKASAAKLKQLGEIHGMKLQDFVIIGERRYFSFSDEGLV